MKTFTRRLGLAAGLALLALSSAAANAQSIVLASTTSVQDSGLLNHLLPAFTASTGIQVRVVAQGTGQALATAARGDADLVLVHDPEAEAKFIREGHGTDPRQIAWNDFIIVGPSSDPAKVVGTHDALAALKAIAAAKAPFVSRGDKSGTDALEKRLWRAAGRQPSLAEGDQWYRDIGGGMGAALNAAAGMNAYTLSDRGTWLSFGNKQSLKIAVEGDKGLLNRYDVILMDPKKHPEAKHDAALKLRDWLISDVGQSAIGAYRVHGEVLFNPSARAPK
ncbi:MAG: substrate-binding domain-containing protein [Proteobacteria bacterium]|nr:substrate-binding domain-containing protein [Pseudomonadota bacterium]